MKLIEWKCIRWTLPIAFALMIACVGMTQEQDEDDGDEVIKSINDVPAAVREAATKTCGTEFKKISKETEHGVVCYEFECVKNGAECSAVFTDQGVLCAVENTIDPSKLPKSMLAEIQKRYPGATIQRSETTEVHGFEVLLKIGGKTKSVEASATGYIAGGRGEEGEEEEEGEEGEEGEGRK
ncbi:MAG: hypothetical protein ABI054_08630 [Planctomycetota bacterium]